MIRGQHCASSLALRRQHWDTPATCHFSHRPLCRLPFHATIFGVPSLWFDSRQGAIFQSNMPTDSEQTVIHRKTSELGKVFPSGVRVGKTPYGLGVFAFAFIPKGTPIARVSGYVIHDPNYGSDYCIDAGNGKVLEPTAPFCYLNHSCEPNCQLMQYVREEYADESEEMETGELTEDDMNFEEHYDLTDDDCIYGGAEDENLEDEIIEGEATGETEFDEQAFEDDADAEIWVESIQDIMLNEELTIDYAWPADRAVKCLCGKPLCRGWIVDASAREHLSR